MIVIEQAEALGLRAGAERVEPFRHFGKAFHRPEIFGKPRDDEARVADGALKLRRHVPFFFQRIETDMRADDPELCLRENLLPLIGGPSIRLRGLDAVKPERRHLTHHAFGIVGGFVAETVELECE